MHGDSTAIRYARLGSLLKKASRRSFSLQTDSWKRGGIDFDAEDALASDKACSYDDVV